MRQVIIKVSLEELHWMLGLPYGVTIKDVLSTDNIVRIKLEADKFQLVPDGEPIPTAKMRCHTTVKFVTVEEEIK